MEKKQRKPGSGGPRENSGRKSSSLYFNRAMEAMDTWGKIKWKEAQDEVARLQTEKKVKYGKAPLYSKTNYKP